MAEVNEPSLPSGSKSSQLKSIEEPVLEPGKNTGSNPVLNCDNNLPSHLMNGYVPLRDSVSGTGDQTKYSGTITNLSFSMKASNTGQEVENLDETMSATLTDLNKLSSDSDGLPLNNITGCTSSSQDYDFEEKQVKLTSDINQKGIVSSDDAEESSGQPDGQANDTNQKDIDSCNDRDDVEASLDQPDSKTNGNQTEEPVTLGSEQTEKLQNEGHNPPPKEDVETESTDRQSIENEGLKTAETDLPNKPIEHEAPVVVTADAKTEGTDFTNKSQDRPSDLEDETPLAAAVAGSDAESDLIHQVYHIKWIRFDSKKLPIITQNENGPCPLIAIANVLLLKGHIVFPDMLEFVTAKQLVDYLADRLFEHPMKPNSEDDGTVLNYEQNMQDAISIFHKLSTGLDVNVRFGGVTEFEYTSECVVFDLFQMRLMHGWLPDPESPEIVTAVGSLSYNQLVEKIISQKHSSRHELVTEALIAEQFLQTSASQLTYHGLCELNVAIPDNDLCVFFRNNHFSTIHKHKDELFLLVTDQGFLTEPNIVWETLSSVEGDSHFADADFKTYLRPSTEGRPPVQPMPENAGTSNFLQNATQQESIDRELALALAQEMRQEASALQTAEHSAAVIDPSHHFQSDAEFAAYLQRQENLQSAASYSNQNAPDHRTTRQQNQPSAQGANRPHQTRRRNSSDSNCRIL